MDASDGLDDLDVAKGGVTNKQMGGAARRLQGDASALDRVALRLQISQ